MNADVGEDRDRLLREAVGLRQAGRREEAREQLVRLAALLPADEEVAYQTAWVHDTLGLEAEAVPYYERALAGDALAGNDRRGALLGLGSTYRILGRYEEAVATLGDAVAEFPHDNGLKTFLAMALYNVGRTHDAMQLLLTLLVATSNDPEVEGYRPAIEEYAKDLDATI